MDLAAFTSESREERTNYALVVGMREDGKQRAVGSNRGSRLEACGARNDGQDNGCDGTPEKWAHCTGCSSGIMRLVAGDCNRAILSPMTLRRALFGDALVDRRSAIRGLAAMAVTPLVAHSGVGEVNRRRLERIGLALYTVRDLTSRDYERTLQQVAEIGYRDVDMYIYDARREPAQTRAMLDRAGLSCPSARVATPALYRGWDRFLDAANTLGARWITLANISYEERIHLRDWEELAEVLNKCGDAARQRGLTLCYHNHSFELEPLEGRVPLDMLLASTQPELVRLQMDVYWMTHGRRDPAAEIRRLGSRVATLHLKDMDASPARGITSVGRGIIDFRAVLTAAADARVAHYFVEEDAPANSLAAIRSSYQHLERLEF
jgi:sugar phosphate isomerase/epimerase